MAVAAALIPGFTYIVNQGPLKGERATIVDNKAFPDADETGEPHPLARKITVKIGNEDFYILPRQLRDTPVADPMFTGVAQVPTHTVIVHKEDTTAMTTPARTALVPVEESTPITDPMDPRLDHLRPSEAKVKHYVNRIMSNGMKDVDFLLRFTDPNHRAENQGRPANVMLKGDTQGGKTFLVEALAVAWAFKMGLPKPMPIFTLSGSSGVTDFDLFGQPAPYYDPATGQERIVWLPGTVSMAAQVGGILYLDECNALGERVTTSLHPIADHRHTFTNRNKPVKIPGDGFMAETVTTSTNLWLIGTFNEGYRGMSDMNEAFINRFRHIEWGYDEKVERALVSSPTIHLFADALRQARSQSKLRTPVGTASLQRLALDIDTFGYQVALQVFVSVFKQQERDVVRTIITDRSIDVLLDEEAKSNAAMNADMDAAVASMRAKV